MQLNKLKLKISDYPNYDTERTSQVHVRHQTHCEELSNIGQKGYFICTEEINQNEKALYPFSTQRIKNRYLNENEENKSNHNIIVQVKSNNNELNSVIHSNNNFLSKLIEYKKEINMLKEEISKMKQFNINKIVI